MRSFYFLIPVLLASCNPYAIVTDDKIVASAGFMSKSQGFAGKGKTAHGATLSWSSVGADSTDVPISVSNTALGLGIANNTFKTADSNNAADIAKKKIATEPAKITAQDNAAVNLQNAKNAVPLAEIAKTPSP